MIQLGIKKLHDDAIIPKYQTEGASGLDLHTVESAVIKPGQTVLISTGLAFDIPEGYEVQLRPRSGVSLKTELLIKNSPATIDSDYSGEIKIIAKNNSYLTVDENNNIIYPEAIVIEKGTRLVQAVLTPVIRASINVIDDLKDTERNVNGFGSTGLK